MTGNSSAPASSGATTYSKAQEPVTQEAAHATPVNGTGASPGVNAALAALCAIARHHQVTPDLTHQLDLSTSEVPAILILSQKDMNIVGKRMSLRRGMNITAEIKTGQRRVIEFLLSPMQRAASESLREP